MFALMVMGGAVGGGNMFQVNQTVEAFIDTFQIGARHADWGIGITMAVIVGIVILGGVKRIGAATSKIVPSMCGLYVLASIYIILVHFTKVPECLLLIFKMAFTDNAVFGGAIGVMMMGIRRAVFSNEAGLGSAAIAHAAAKTEEPVREGIVAMIGPFIDTIIVCLMTSLVVIITGAWNDPQFSQNGGFSIGVSMTTHAFGTVLPWFKYILTGCIGLFAYSTMISWCYYGERGWIYLLDHFNGIGLKSVVVFRVAFLIFIVIGAVNKLSDVVDFSDLMILSMAFPNIIGSILLARKVKEKVSDYWNRYSSGKMPVFQK
jgi:AGCS family alanine or glycine:cation symporter